MEEKKSEEELTTIALKRTTLKLLQERKIHPNQSYDEVVIELLEKEKK